MGGATYRAGLSLVFLVTLIPPRIGICHWGEHARGPWDIRDRPQVLSEMGEGGLSSPSPEEQRLSPLQADTCRQGSAIVSPFVSVNDSCPGKAFAHQSADGWGTVERFGIVSGIGVHCPHSFEILLGVLCSRNLWLRMTVLLETGDPVNALPFSYVTHAGPPVTSKNEQHLVGLGAGTGRLLSARTHGRQFGEAATLILCFGHYAAPGLGPKFSGLSNQTFASEI